MWANRHTGFFSSIHRHLLNKDICLGHLLLPKQFYNTLPGQFTSYHNNTTPGNRSFFLASVGRNRPKAEPRWPKADATSGLPRETRSRDSGNEFARAGVDGNRPGKNLLGQLLRFASFAFVVYLSCSPRYQRRKCSSSPLDLYGRLFLSCYFFCESFNLSVL